MQDTIAHVLKKGKVNRLNGRSPPDKLVPNRREEEKAHWFQIATVLIQKKGTNTETRTAQGYQDGSFPNGGTKRTIILTKEKEKI